MRLLLSQFEAAILIVSGKMPFSEDIRHAPETETVCYCSEVTKGDILRAVTEGARSVAYYPELNDNNSAKLSDYLSGFDFE
jgi:NAD(P)H-nitrite reductase large subunit